MYSDKVIVFQRFRNFSQSWGEAIIRGAAIKREITVHVFAFIYFLFTEIIKFKNGGLPKQPGTARLVT